MANTELVSFGDTGSDSPFNETSSNMKNTNITLQQTQATSSVSKITITGSSIIWEALMTTELSNEIKETFYHSSRTKTKRRYEGILTKLRNHCIQRNENPYITDIKSVLMSLHGMYKNSCLYSGICEVPCLVLL